MKFAVRSRIDKHNDFAAWAFLVAVSASRKKPIKELIPDERGEVDVVLLVNGVEIPFDKVMERLDAERDRQIERLARAMVVERLNDEMNPIHNALFNKRLRRKLNELLLLSKDFDDDD